MSKLKLFVELARRSWFHFYDTPRKSLIKTDNSHYIGETGRRLIHPYVAVIEEKINYPRRKSIFDMTKSKGDSDGHATGETSHNGQDSSSHENE